MAGWLTSDLDHLPAVALREMHAHATAMRDLVARHVNSGPGGLWGRLDRLASDIESGRGYPYQESQEPGEEDEDEEPATRTVILRIEAVVPASTAESSVETAVNLALDEPPCDWGTWAVGAAVITAN